jgi:hypothetical protein
MIEKLIWLGFAAAVAVVFYLSGDGFYRYPCQDPANWSALECTPPICLRTGMCADALTGGNNVP